MKPNQPPDRRVLQPLVALPPAEESSGSGELPAARQLGSRQRRAATALTSAALVAGCSVLLASATVSDAGGETPPEAAADEPREAGPSSTTPAPVAGGPAATHGDFDGQQAYAYLQQICAIGPRISGTPGMVRQQALLQEHFNTLGGKVGWQRFRFRQRTGGRSAEMANLVVEWAPEARQRILLCCHYDTRPRPDMDPDPRQRQQGTFLGANDGGSGVALLMELARCLPRGALGVDFVFFDGEEFVWDAQRDVYFAGSTHFARQYRADPPEFRYLAGVLLDMVGDARLSVYQERYSARWSDTRPIVQELWATARELGVREFIPEVGYEVRDDHLPLRQIGRIPVANVIDFRYPDQANRYWHTTADTPEHCSGDSLEKVGRVIQRWLQKRLQ